MFKHLFAAIALLISVAVQAVTLPVHHQYTNHYTDTGERLYNYDIHITWNNEPDVRAMGFYTQFAFYFQNGTVGYMGLQTDSHSKKAIFSLWDANTRTRAHPANHACTRFGHEGTGASCIIKFDWEVGVEYKLRVWKLSVNSNSGRVQWGGWVINTKTGEETLIGVIELDNDGELEGYGSLGTHTIATMENYQATALTSYQCHQQPYFNVSWYGPVANNGSIYPRTSVPVNETSVGQPCIQNARAVGGEMWTTVSEVGFGVSTGYQDGVDLWAHYDHDSARTMDCIFNWFERQLPDTFNQSRFHHRRLSRSHNGVYYRDYSSEQAAPTVMVRFSDAEMFMGPPGVMSTHLGTFDTWARSSGCRQ